MFIIIDEERATQPHSESVMKFGGKKGSSSHGVSVKVRSNRVGNFHDITDLNTLIVAYIVKLFVIYIKSFPCG